MSDGHRRGSGLLQHEGECGRTGDSRRGPALLPNHPYDQHGKVLMNRHICMHACTHAYTLFLVLSLYILYILQVTGCSQPAQQEISSEEGNEDLYAYGTYDCPTTGGVNLTISGEYFTGDVVSLDLTIPITLATPASPTYIYIYICYVCIWYMLRRL